MMSVHAELDAEEGDEFVEMVIHLLHSANAMEVNAQMILTIRNMLMMVMIDEFEHIMEVVTGKFDYADDNDNGGHDDRGMCNNI